MDCAPLRTVSGSLLTRSMFSFFSWFWLISDSLVHICCKMHFNFLLSKNTLCSSAGRAANSTINHWHAQDFQSPQRAYESWPNQSACTNDQLIMISLVRLNNPSRCTGSFWSATRPSCWASRASCGALSARSSAAGGRCTSCWPTLAWAPWRARRSRPSRSRSPTPPSASTRCTRSAARAYNTQSLACWWLTRSGSSHAVGRASVICI